MHLCVLGAISLDELEACVVRHFGGLRGGVVAPSTAPNVADDAGVADELAAAVEDAAMAAVVAETAAVVAGVADTPNTALPRGPFSDKQPNTALPRGPFSDKQRGGLLRATPVRETRLLRLLWEVPPEAEFAESKAMRLLSSMLSFEGEGGLAWLLTQRLDPPLATSLSCGPLYGMSDATLYGITLTLTPEGLAKYGDAMELVFGYVRMLTKQAAPGGPGIPQYLFDERAAMSRIAFAYAEQSEPVRGPLMASDGL
jgi:secreted Zn-dependent insulinase-like peptidase